MKSESDKIPYFQWPALFFEVMKMLSSYTFRAPARRFIMFELFDKIQWSHDSFPNSFDKSGLASDEKGISEAKPPPVLPTNADV